jgi:type II secretory pathway component PulF
MSVDTLDHSVTEALRALRVQHASGIAVEQSLATCATVCSAGSSRDCFLEAASRAKKGESIESLMDALSPLLSDTERATVVAGWNGGRIEAVLDSVVAQRELWYSSRRHIRAQMIMPVLVLVIASFVAPVPAFIAGQLGIIGYVASALTPLVLCFVGWTFLAKVLWGAKPVSFGGPKEPPAPPTSSDDYKLRLPVISVVERNRCLAEYSSCMGNLISAGVPITQALETCARAMSNGVYRQAVMRSAEVTRGGNLLSTSLFPTDIWPLDFVAAVRVGEQSGKMDEVLLRYADSARENYVRAIDAFAQWLPRVIYGVIALFVIYNIFKLAGVYIGILDSAMKGEG